MNARPTPPGPNASLADRLLRRLAVLLVRGPDAPHVLGDLDETLHRDLASGVSPWRARRRYLADAVASSATIAAAQAGTMVRRVPVPGVSLLDLKLAFRMLAKHPGLTAVAVFALALGIPASLYPFHMLSILDGEMPFGEGERIVGLRYSYIDVMDEAEGTIHDYEAWRGALPSLAEIGAARPIRINLATEARLGPWRGASGPSKQERRLPLVSDSSILSDMARKRSPKQLEKRLRECRSEYARIKARIRDVGFICEGSLVERWTSCGKPNCRCTSDPPQRHGPYYQLTWKEHGKTVTRRLPAEQAELYQEWIANRRELEALLQQMREISWQAGGYLLEATVTPGDPATTSAPPSRPPKPGRG